MKKQRKTGRPRAEKPMMHTAVMLPQSLLDRLKSDAQTSARGLSGEIRHRLEMLQGLDLHTTKLVENTIKLADKLARDLGRPWHEHEFTRKALQAGFAVFLGYDPDGEGHAAPYTGHPHDAPHDVVGQTHARIILMGQQGE